MFRWLSIGYAVYFLAKASGLLAKNITHGWGRPLDVVVVAAYTASMLFWLVGLSRQGEEKTLVIGHRWNREDQDQVLERLKASIRVCFGPEKEWKKTKIVPGAN